MRQQACEQHGCCFVWEPEKATRTQERECYLKPFAPVPEWLTLPPEQCTAHCIHHKAESNAIHPTQKLRSRCMLTDGSLGLAGSCDSPDPPTSQTCDWFTEECPRCDNDCGYGYCYRKHTKFYPWLFEDICVCPNGVISTDGLECNVDARECAWSDADPEASNALFSRSSCVQPPGGSGAVGVIVIRDPTCSCASLPSNTGGACGPRPATAQPTQRSCALCDCSAVPAPGSGSVGWCNGEEARLTCPASSGGSGSLSMVLEGPMEGSSIRLESPPCRMKQPTFSA